MIEDLENIEFSMNCLTCLMSVDKNMMCSMVFLGTNTVFSLSV
jgi:hypothetical protein